MPSVRQFVREKTLPLRLLTLAQKQCLRCVSREPEKGKDQQETGSVVEQRIRSHSRLRPLEPDFILNLEPHAFRPNTGPR